MPHPVLTPLSPTAMSTFTPADCLPTLPQVRQACQWVYAAMPPTPQYAYPMLATAAGCNVWVKHENHTPLGAFKMRGGLVYGHKFLEQYPDTQGFITATKGNHGQSVAYVAKQYGLKSTIVVPTNNSQCTNAAMQALGAEVISHGLTIADSMAYAAELVQQRPHWHQVPAYHPWLIQGVATYALELFEAAPPLDAVFVAVGKGSGISGVLALRNALQLDTQVIGVVAEGAPAYANAFASGQPYHSASVNTLACGVAIPSTEPVSLQVIREGASEVLAVSDELILKGMRLYYDTTHNVACGAGAIALAGLLSQQERWAGKRVGVILSGSNVDASVWQRCLS
jgi:threonine dehydratase